MSKLSKEEFIEECKKFLDFFDIDYRGDVLFKTSGGNSVVMRECEDFHNSFVGHSINSVVEFVAEEMGKEVKWIR